MYFGVVHLRQIVQPGLRHGNDPHVRLDGAKRVIGGLGAGFGQRVEKGAFAHVRQADHAEFHSLLLGGERVFAMVRRAFAAVQKKRWVAYRSISTKTPRIPV